MQRVSVVGNAGSGKSTVSRDLAARLGAPVVELDAIFHQPDWTDLPPQQFRHRVAQIVQTDSWVVDGNYPVVLDLVWARADTVVWLDPPRRIVLRQVGWRTVSRGVLRRELWNGNREQLSQLLRRDPGSNIVLWAWRNFESYRTRFLAASLSPANRHLRFHRLTSRAEMALFLDGAEPLPSQEC